MSALTSRANHELNKIIIIFTSYLRDTSKTIMHCFHSGLIQFINLLLESKQTIYIPVFLFHLGLPKTPNITDIWTSSHSALLIWTQPKQTPDQIIITNYKIKIKDEITITDTALTQYILSILTPNTDYNVKVMAVSRIGESAWSKTKTYNHTSRFVVMG
jgi:hypothetical protein